MKFVGDSSLSDLELGEIAQGIVDMHGEDARDVVNRLIDRANIDGDFAAHAKWLNVSLGVLRILRPSPAREAIK